jgi:hypothetical protein
MGVLSPGPASAKIGARRENPAALFLLAQLSEWILAARPLKAVPLTGKR